MQIKEGFVINATYLARHAIGEGPEAVPRVLQTSSSSLSSLTSLSITNNRLRTRLPRTPIKFLLLMLLQMADVLLNVSLFKTNKTKSLFRRSLKQLMAH